MNNPKHREYSSWSRLCALALSGLGACLATLPHASAATVGVFYGGDPEDGLDLQGNFIYALNIGTGVAAGRAGDANFTADNVAGVIVTAEREIADWNTAAAYGDTANDNALEYVIRSIRWSHAVHPTTPVVRAQLADLEVGAGYKLQLLFGEGCCPQRAFDIYLNGALAVDEFNPGGLQGGYNLPNLAAYAMEEFMATSPTLEIVLDGRTVTTPEFGDHNPVLSGVTLEKTFAATDSDADSLSDEWEIQQFGNLDQDATDDPDADGLQNREELQYHTDPTRADPDNDGLSDGEEIQTHHTDPGRADTDGDGLKDGDEVQTYHTDPLMRDTDNDGLTDGAEVAAGTNPTDPPSQFSSLKIESFTGGDPGEGFDGQGNPTEGLDLQGSFLYAVNVSSAGPAGRAYDANFTADTVPGVAVTANENAPAWAQPSYGGSVADNVLERVTQSIRFGPIVSVRLTGLVPGSTYKLQTFFYEQCCANRGFNVYADGTLIAENLVPAEIQGGVNILASGAMLSFEFLTHRDNLYLVLNAAAASREDLTDPNAVLGGFTLEILNLVAPPTISLTRAPSGQLTISTDSTLQVADDVSGPFTNLPVSTTTVDPLTAASPKFYRGMR